MKILLAILVVLALYPLIGTLLFGITERTKWSHMTKVLLLVYGHPALTALLLWVCCSPFDREIAYSGVLLVAGSILRIPFSSMKFLTQLHKTSTEISIDYLTPLFRHKSITIPVKDISSSEVSTGRRLIDKPTTLKLNIGENSLKMYALEKLQQGTSLT